MSYHCELTKLSPKPALTVRAQVLTEDLSDMFENAFAALIEYLEEMGEDIAGPPFAIYHSIETDRLDVEAGLPVTKTLPGKGDIRSSEIVIDQGVSTTHSGQYEEIEEAYIALLEWIAENGYEPTGITYEFYLNDPGTTPQEELRTEVIMPVRSATGNGSEPA